MDDSLQDVVETVAHAQLHPYAKHAIQEIVRLADAEQRLRTSHPGLVERVQAAAERALGTHEQAWWYLRSHQRVLDSVPLDLLSEGEGGARRVEAILGRIQHGVYT